LCFLHDRPVEYSAAPVSSFARRDRSRQYSGTPEDDRPSGAIVDVSDISHQIEADQSGQGARSHDPYAALRIRDYRFYAIGSFIAAMTGQMLDVAVAWEISERVGQVAGSRDAALALGYVGLVLALPVIFFALPAGHVADRFDRRRVTLITLCLTAIGSVALAGISYTNAPVSWVYACIFLLGVSNSFRGPALGAMLPQLVPDELLANAGNVEFQPLADGVHDWTGPWWNSHCGHAQLCRDLPAAGAGYCSLHRISAACAPAQN
jgi:hypothetical protein